MTRIYLKLELEKSIENPDDRMQHCQDLLQEIEQLAQALGWRIVVVQRGMRPSTQQKGRRS